MKQLETQVNLLDQLFDIHIKTVNSLKDLDSLNIKYLGKNGQINQLFKKVPSQQKPILGPRINALKNKIIRILNDRKKLLQKTQDETSFDITIPGITSPLGHLHPISQAIKEIEDIFSKLGFIRRRYPEIDTDWYAAEGLNIPKSHPARDDQETFYVSDNLVLTAHTSNGQLHEMELMKNPPIRMINIGKTYRRQIDASHTPMFHQFEGLLVDQGVNISHLIGVSNYFVKNYFNSESKIRLRPHHFQFTEPSFEVDIVCSSCHGQGCRLCKAGWLELGGAGMVHPQVLKNGGINPQKYTGFAFGWGIERVIAIKHRINDIRYLYTTDLRILNQV